MCTWRNSYRSAAIYSDSDHITFFFWKKQARQARSAQTSCSCLQISYYSGEVLHIHTWIEKCFLSQKEVTLVWLYATAGSWLGPKWWTCCSDTSHWIGPFYLRHDEGKVAGRLYHVKAWTQTKNQGRHSSAWNYAIISDRIRIHEYILHKCGVVLHEQKFRRESRIRATTTSDQTMAGDLAWPPLPFSIPPPFLHIFQQNFRARFESTTLCASVWRMNDQRDAMMRCRVQAYWFGWSMGCSCVRWSLVRRCHDSCMLSRCPVLVGNGMGFSFILIL